MAVAVVRRMTRNRGLLLSLLLGVVTFAGACEGGAGEECSNPCDGVCMGGRCLTTLSSSTYNTLGAIAVDGTSVYFVNGGVPTGSTPGIDKLPTSGGSSTGITSGQTAPSALALDASHVYWTTWGDAGTGGTLKSAPTGGPPSTTLASNLSGPAAVAVDAVNVYFTEGTAGRVSKVPLAGGTPVVLASDLAFPGAIAVDAQDIYWVENGTDGRPSPAGDTKIVSMPIGGGARTTLATAGVRASGSDLTLVGDTVYWTFSVYETIEGKSVCTLGKVLSVPKAGGPTKTLASGQDGPTAIVADPTAVYWTNAGNESDGAVMKLPLAGGAPVALAANRARPVDLAVDATSVYWTEAGTGAVMKTSKE
jgi:hypothetical protein